MVDCKACDGKGILVGGSLPAIPCGQCKGLGKVKPYSFWTFIWNYFLGRE